MLARDLAAITYKRRTYSNPFLGEDGQQSGKFSLVSANSSQLYLTCLPETTELRANGQDVAVIPVELTDKSGTRRVLQDREVSVAVTGKRDAGTLAGFGTAEASTYANFTDTTVKSYYGRAMAVVRAGLQEGQLSVTFSAPGCEPVTCVINVT
ncbi:Beta-galactosidase/beta-glucuronidase [Glarea lozoyensis ATCC 20868]|uniref:Beta-galactosidase/beta-glucuronidase n=1 Tax=Glarea lozoyensis (strain ATCC 20868 / MF5171) TaxID=1116229 RepID=S3DI89_GLAL2|nr:Beta-galactosidase/beta-glucuronidase [Glarea lozoyensis ATCC 20868]EPE31741.1 Beta-galactosidase/beta-glucuronidase [Glarea lozoyensis ATCC 20868]